MSTLERPAWFPEDQWATLPDGQKEFAIANPDATKLAMGIGNGDTSTDTDVTDTDDDDTDEDVTSVGVITTGVPDDAIAEITELAKSVTDEVKQVIHAGVEAGRKAKHQVLPSYIALVTAYAMEGKPDPFLTRLPHVDMDRDNPNRGNRPFNTFTFYTDGKRDKIKNTGSVLQEICDATVGKEYVDNLKAINAKREEKASDWNKKDLEADARVESDRLRRSRGYFRDATRIGHKLADFAEHRKRVGAVWVYEKDGKTIKVCPEPIRIFDYAYVKDAVGQVVPEKVNGRNVAVSTFVKLDFAKASKMDGGVCIDNLVKTVRKGRKSKADEQTGAMLGQDVKPIPSAIAFMVEVGEMAAYLDNAETRGNLLKLIASKNEETDALLFDLSLMRRHCDNILAMPEYKERLIAYVDRTQGGARKPLSDRQQRIMDAFKKEQASKAKKSKAA